MFEIGRAAPGRRAVLRALAGAGTLAVTLQRRSAWAQDTQVMIDNFTFSPNPLTVKVGTTVTWVNNDDMPHSIVCPALKFRSPALDTGSSFAHRFDEVGTYDYLCGLHAFMHGRVVVSS
jgi:plastocyanin